MRALCKFKNASNVQVLLVSCWLVGPSPRNKFPVSISSPDLFCRTNHSQTQTLQALKPRNYLDIMVRKDHQSYGMKFSDSWENYWWCHLHELCISVPFCFLPVSSLLPLPWGCHWSPWLASLDYEFRILKIANICSGRVSNQGQVTIILFFPRESCQSWTSPNTCDLLVPHRTNVTMLWLFFKGFLKGQMSL